MTGCTATLQTVEHSRLDFYCTVCDTFGVTVCTGYDHYEVHTLTCDGKPPCPARHAYVRGATELYWEDSTPGAQPHTPPSVSDAEVQAVALAWLDLTGRTMPKDRARRLAEAAAEARQP